MMRTSPIRPGLAATLALAVLAGCAELPAAILADAIKTGASADDAGAARPGATATATRPATGTTAGATSGAPTGGAAGSTAATAAAKPAAATTAAKAPITAPTAFAPPAVAAKVTADADVTAAEEAKALAANDEQLLEAASASFEGDEAKGVYALNAVRGGESAQGWAREGLSGGVARGALLVPAQVAIVLVVPVVAVQLTARRTQAQRRQQAFLGAHPAYADEQAGLRRALDGEGWRPNADDRSTLCKRGRTSERPKAGGTREIEVQRVVSKAKPHHLVCGRTELAERRPDGGHKAARWEKVLRADGAYVISFRHELTARDGKRWITEWEKVLFPDGRLRGRGRFGCEGPRGQRLADEVVTIGGDDAGGQVVECQPTATATPTPAPTATPTAAPTGAPSAEASATPTPAPTPEATATPTPAATATPEPEPTATPTPEPCEDCSATGGGRLAGTSYSFGFSKQVVTINDVDDPGVDLKADVTAIRCNGTTATITGTLRAPEAGTVTLVVSDLGEGANAPDDVVTFMRDGVVLAAGALTRGNPGGGNVQVRAGCD